MLEKFKDPMSTLTHLIGFVFAFPVTFFLIYKGYYIGSKIHIIAFVIFGASLILLYGASTFHHMLSLPKKSARILRKFDHMMIFVLIAGTYTPICLIKLKGVWGTSLLIGVWILALIGLLYKMFKINTDRRITSALYIIMGWLVVIAFVPLVKSMQVGGLVMLILGGISYSIGGVIYAIKKPNFKYFNFHDVFHVFVLLGSLFHILLMFIYV